MNPSLPPDLSSFVEQQVASGAFGSADEVLVASLRQMQERERKLTELRTMIDEADAEFERGEYIELCDETLPAFFEHIKPEGRAELTAEREGQHGKLPGQRAG